MMNIIRRELRANRRTLLIWGVSLALLNLLLMALYPSFAQEAESLNEFMQVMPEAFSTVFGLDRVNMADPLGFYAIEAYFMVILFGGIFAAMLGAGILSGEEESRTIEFLLAKPISRLTVLKGKILGFLAILGLFNVLISMVTYLSFLVFVPKGYSHAILAYLLIAPLFAQVLFASLGFLVGMFATRRKSAVSLGIGLVVMLYFLQVIATLSERFDFLRFLTPFYYLDAVDIILDGSINPVGVLVLSGGATLALYVAGKVYLKKDIVVV